MLGVAKKYKQQKKTNDLVIKTWRLSFEHSIQKTSRFLNRENINFIRQLKFILLVLLSRVEDLSSKCP